MARQQALLPNSGPSSRAPGPPPELRAPPPELRGLAPPPCLFLVSACFSNFATAWHALAWLGHQVWLADAYPNCFSMQALHDQVASLSHLDLAFRFHFLLRFLCFGQQV